MSKQVRASKPKKKNIRSKNKKTELNKSEPKITKPKKSVTPKTTTKTANHKNNQPQSTQSDGLNTVYPAPSKFTVILADVELAIDPDDVYKIFNEEVLGDQVLAMDFDYLPYPQQIIVQSLLQRSKEIPISFHPDVVYSLTEDKENSLYYKKNPNEVEAVLMKEGTKNITRDKEAASLRQKVDLNTQGIRNRRSVAVGFAVKLGYDRTFVKEVLTTLIEETDTGIMSLEPKRICAYIDDRIREDAQKRTIEERRGNKNLKSNQAQPTKKLKRIID